MILFSAVVLAIAFAGTYPEVGIVFPVLVSVAILAGTRSKSVFSTLPAQLLGKWSYGIYLTHAPMVFIYRKIMGEGSDSGAVAKLVMIVATVVVAAGLYHFIEEPMIKWGRRFQQQSGGETPTPQAA